MQLMSYFSTAFANYIDQAPRGEMARLAEVAEVNGSQISKYRSGDSAPSAASIARIAANIPQADAVKLIIADLIDRRPDDFSDLILIQPAKSFAPGTSEPLPPYPAAARLTTIYAAHWLLTESIQSPIIGDLFMDLIGTIRPTAAQEIRQRCTQSNLRVAEETSRYEGQQKQQQ